MPGFDHRLPDEQDHHDPTTVARNAQYGLNLFVVYSAIYAGFVLLNAFRPDLMESTPWAGINLDVLFGLGLIIGAFLLSLIYGWLCRESAEPGEGTPGGP